jgi:hypothetical protein
MVVERHRTATELRGERPDRQRPRADPVGQRDRRVDDAVPIQPPAGGSAQVGATFPLVAAAEAIEALEAGAARGKIVLEVRS